jgi:hypothetical protein
LEPNQERHLFRRCGNTRGLRQLVVKTSTLEGAKIQIDEAA